MRRRDEVRHNPVPGGGFVLIYSDITERKSVLEPIVPKMQFIRPR